FAGPESSRPWLRLPLPASAGGIQARLNKRGLIELYFRNRTSGHMMLAMQASANIDLGAWQPTVDLGFPYTGHPAVGLDEKGELIAAAVDATGTLWLIEQGTAQRLGAGFASMPAILAAKGDLYIAARTSSDQQAYKLWKRSRGMWTAELLLDPPPPGGGSSFTFNGSPLLQASNAAIVATTQAG